MTAGRRDLATIAVGAILPSQERTPGPVELFSFTSAIGMAHRIHYDLAFTVGVERRRALVVPGPLQAAYLTQLVQVWAGDGVRVTRLAYRHRSPAFAEEPLRCLGQVSAVDAPLRQVICRVWTENAAREVLTTGEIALRWP